MSCFANIFFVFFLFTLALKLECILIPIADCWEGTKLGGLGISYGNGEEWNEEKVIGEENGIFPIC